MQRLIMRRLSCIFIFLLFFTNLKAQQYEVIYELYIQASTEKDSLITEETSLVIFPEQQISFFSNLGEQKRKDFFKQIREEAKINPDISHVDYSAVPEYVFAYSVLKNLKTNEHSFYEEVLGDTYNYGFDLNLNWNITGDKKQILDYACQKATLHFGGRQWTAYFTQEIPFSDGPYKFHGLPGLILEIYSEDGDYSFSAKGIQTLKTEFIAPKSLKMRKASLDKYKEKLAEKPSIAFVNKMQSSGLTGSVSYNGKPISNSQVANTYDKEVKEWMKNHNNPIEKDMIWLDK
ncbi:GLPGLI family protein [Weeksellaceae bacterium KMM 9724]|uniref:GLPGLI family protein n=1 Tax=Profundicola chukchiensis TaxID=2961959 RepID=UPI002438296C|nr:GLPGLI family protein [Profundicola chukchiensis]MDG4950454.1 GLPGLI family protein [Profundicola chukchiensis]